MAWRSLLIPALLADRAVRHKKLQRCVPIDFAFVGQKMFVVFAVVVVDMRGYYSFAHEFERAGMPPSILAWPVSKQKRRSFRCVSLTKFWRVCGAPSSLGVFSSAMVTPRCLAKMARCSRELKAASINLGSADCRLLPRCCTKYLNGMRSATSMARFTSSTASSRRTRSPSEIEIGVPLSCRPAVSRWVGECIECSSIPRSSSQLDSSRIASVGGIIKMRAAAKYLDFRDSGVTNGA